MPNFTPRDWRILIVNAVEVTVVRVVFFRVDFGEWCQWMAFLWSWKCQPCEWNTLCCLTHNEVLSCEVKLSLRIAC